ncbi:hypothetical protein KQ874_00085 [Mycoplasma sp. ES3157-GEN-MYC]|uniref:Uncharacterized protein n=1 Tax=Mycoplasma miroungigenitalium TaxID=754515 RepID=A0A6M4J9Z9_9MOLU|nr:hypothetical protein [Mycoplasma miroungigenitalium]MBU4690107.1 hypothetical protein [Mycoplasma miroungigenitalium]MBU4691379.1 hypothetical protein [Mycoplasma miroungigenitalium]QJR43215.1 hypothetical protein HLA87_00090 [Mycoplasma miroungigenitalium]
MYWNNRITIKITLAGLMLALAIVCDLIGQFIPFNGFLKFNLSLIFTLASFRFIGIWWGILVLLIMLFIGPSYSAFGYDILGLLGHGMLIVSQAIFILFYLIFYNYLTKLLKNKKPFKVELISNLASLSLANVCATIALVIINVFVVTPLYFYLFKVIKTPGFTEMVNSYDKVKGLFFYIPNYLLASTIVYGTFNLVNFAINSILLTSILTFDLKLGFSKYLQNNNKKIKKESLCQTSNTTKMK